MFLRLLQVLLIRHRRRLRLLQFLQIRHLNRDIFQIIRSDVGIL